MDAPSKDPDTQRRITALDLMIIQRGLRGFWFKMWLITMLVALAGAWYLSQLFSQNRQVIVMDPAKTYYLAEAEDLNSSKTFHSTQAVLAMEAFFDRHPKGPDHPKRLELLFTKTALSKARKRIQAEAEEFQEKELHSKVEVGPIEILRVRDQSIRIAVEGQVIRTGVFRDQPLTEVLHVKAQFRFIRNPHMLHNGRFPTVVGDFDFDTTLASSS